MQREGPYELSLSGRLHAKAVWLHELATLTLNPTQIRQRELEQFEAYIKQLQLSTNNEKRVIKDVRALVKGVGLCKANQPSATFKAGESIGRLWTCNVEALRAEAEKWVPYNSKPREDLSNGWRWNHQLNYIAKFQGSKPPRVFKKRKQLKGPSKAIVKVSRPKKPVPLPLQPLQPLQPLLPISHPKSGSKTVVTTSDESEDDASDAKSVATLATLATLSTEELEETIESMDTVIKEIHAVTEHEYARRTGTLYLQFTEKLQDADDPLSKAHPVYLRDIKEICDAFPDVCSNALVWQWIDRRYSAMSEREYKDPKWKGLSVYYKPRRTGNGYVPIRCGSVRGAALDHVFAQYGNPFSHPRFLVVSTSGLNLLWGKKAPADRIGLGANRHTMVAIASDMKFMCTFMKKRGMFKEIFAELNEKRPLD